MSHPLSRLLEGFTASSSIFPNGDHEGYHFVWDDTPLVEAFKSMIGWKILSVPVFSKTQQSEYFILSMTGIMNYLLQHFSEEDFKSKDMPTLLQKRESMNVPVSKLKGTDGYEAAVCSNWDEKLIDTIRKMVQFKAHRILIFGNDKKLINIITQSRVLKLIDCGIGSLQKAQRTIAELNLGNKSVISVPMTAMTIEAFRLMKENNISAVAVVDEQGRLAGNISNSDIKHLGYDLRFFQLLGVPVSEYLKAIQIHNKLGVDELRPTRVPVKETDLLISVVNLITYLRVHRVYCVDDEGRPTRVISLLDILKELIDEPTQPEPAPK
jgi:CBS domain-containing protein